MFGSVMNKTGKKKKKKQGVENLSFITIKRLMAA